MRPRDAARKASEDRVGFAPRLVRLGDQAKTGDLGGVWRQGQGVGRRIATVTQPSPAFGVNGLRMMGGSSAGWSDIHSQSAARPLVPYRGALRSVSERRFKM